MTEIIQGIALFVGWFVIVGATSYIWTAMKVLSDNSMTKHKKVCDLCFRDIKKLHAFHERAKAKK